MTHRPRSTPAEARRPYAPPHLQRVSLVPDEAVLATCKNTTTQGPSGASAKCTGAPPVCSHDGS
jgi:hypothetical protein